jgi:structural maintenance of chromosome 1
VPLILSCWIYQCHPHVQGYISELASKSPTEVTQLFEQISGSEEFKDEYDRLEHEKKKAEEEQIYTYQKKK